MQKHYSWITFTLLVFILLFGLFSIVYFNIYYDECDKVTKINIVPFLYLSSYIISVFTLRWLNLKLYSLNKELYEKKEWIWVLPLINTISIPFALFDLLLETNWGKWFKTTELYKTFVDEED
jgi:SNF family Na+-dependent transporter